MKKIILSVSAYLLINFAGVAQNGLEKIIVEKYYVANAADSIDASQNGAIYPLAVGSVTYRVFADMAPDYKFIQLFGSDNHELKITTSTAFFNDPNFGPKVFQGTSLNNMKKYTTMIDSYLSIGGVANGQVGVLKIEDTDGSIGNIHGLLVNNDPSAGEPITGNGAKDGMMPGSPVVPNILGISSELDIFDQTAGDTMSVINGTIAALGGVQGITSSNTVFLGQFTTDGDFGFKFNVQLGTPTSGGSEIYVADNPVGNEILDTTLMYTSVQSVDSSLNIEGIAPVIYSIYPNPSSDFIYIDCSSDLNDEVSVVITDMKGSIIYEDLFFLGKAYSYKKIDINLLQKGAYLVRIADKRGVSTKKFLKH